MSKCIFGCFWVLGLFDFCFCYFFCFRICNITNYNIVLLKKNNWLRQTSHYRHLKFFIKILCIMQYFLLCFSSWRYMSWKESKNRSPHQLASQHTKTHQLSTNLISFRHHISHIQNLSHNLQTVGGILIQAWHSVPQYLGHRCLCHYTASTTMFLSVWSIKRWAVILGFWYCLFIQRPHLLHLFWFW